MVHVAECSFQVTSLLCNLFVYHKAARKPVACETFFQAPQATGSNLEVWGVSTSIKTCTSDPTERERERDGGAGLPCDVFGLGCQQPL